MMLLNQSSTAEGVVCTAKGVVHTGVLCERMSAVTSELPKDPFYCTSLWNVNQMKNGYFCSAQQLFSVSWGILSFKRLDLVLKKSL